MKVPKKLKNDVTKMIQKSIWPGPTTIKWDK